MQNVCALNHTREMSDLHNHYDFECCSDRYFQENSLKNPGKMFKQ